MMTLALRASYYTGRYLIYGKEESTEERLEKKIDSLSCELVELKKSLSKQNDFVHQSSGSGESP